MRGPSHPPLLAVNTIAKNEAHNLPALMGTLRHVVDEWIVCDTGSSDDTVQVARALGARVVFDPWQDDFARARNVARAATKSRFILWLDGDDRMEPNHISEIRWVLESSPDHWGYFLQLQSQHQDPRQASVSGQGRIFPNLPGIHWEGRVHEQFVHSMNRQKYPLNDLPFPVTHTGYLDPKDVRRKYERNLLLLEKEIANGRDTADMRFHLGQTFVGLGRPREALTVFMELTKIRGDVLFEQQIAARSCLLAAQMINDLALQEKTELAELATRIQPDDDFTRAYLADCYMIGNRPQDCRRALEPIMAKGGLGVSLMPYPMEFTKQLVESLWQRSNNGTH